MAKHKKNVLELVSTIVEATKTNGMYHVNDEKLKELSAVISEGKLEFDPNVKNDAGDVAIRATKSYLDELTGVTAAPVKQTFEFEILDGIVPPAPVRAAMKEEIYPFSKLEIGQSFFLPASEKTPDPAKSFASTVSSATRRYSEQSATETKKNRAGADVPVLVPTRRFTIRPVKAGQKWPNGHVEKADGARIFRIAL